MPNERTPLELAKEMTSDRPSLMPELTAELLDEIASRAANASPGSHGWRGPELSHHIRRLIDHARRTIGSGIVAAVLIEKCTPVEATRRQVAVLLCCGSTVSGYPEDHFSRIRPKFCPNCGRPITWK